jgi:1,4-alpha-glucan branching enzyme
MITKRQSQAAGKTLVTFELPASLWAESVHLVGEFNSWNRTSHPFRQDRDGAWRIELEVLQGAEVRFRYLVDGRDWQNDSGADRHTPNPYGGVDSVVIG